MKPFVLILSVVLPAPFRVHIAAPVTGRVTTVPFPALMALAELLALLVLAVGITVIVRRDGGFRILFLRRVRGGAS